MVLNQNHALITSVDLSSLEFTGYLQVNALEESVLLRAKVGYSSNNYEMYAEGKKMDLGASAFSFGDNRTLLNTSINDQWWCIIEIGGNI